MSKRMKRCQHWLRLLANTSGKEQKDLLRLVRPDLVKAICECTINVLAKRIPVSSTQKQKLKRKRKILHSLADKGNSIKTKKKLLIQHGGGFLIPLLAPILGALLGALK